MTPRLHFPGATPEREGEFTPEQARRLFRVLRMRAGDSVILFDGEGNEFAAEIASLSPDAGTARILEARPQTAADFGIRARVGQALCAPNKMDWAVEKMTELGAAEIIPLLTARTVSAMFSPARARRLAAAACEQCGRACVPRVGDAENLTDFLSRPFADARKIVLSPRAEDSLAKILNGWVGVGVGVGVVFLCGPESGLTLEEEALANSAGYVSAHLGARILRAETAALAALATLNAAEK